MTGDRSAIACWAAGASILLLAYLSWMLIGIGGEKENVALMWFLWASPFIGAFLATWLNPRHAIRIVIAVAVTAAVLAILMNTIRQAQGHPVDFPGLDGSLWLAAITLAYGLVLSCLGGGLAWLISRKIIPSVTVEHDNGK